jgi:hypothetical protein
VTSPYSPPVTACDGNAGAVPDLRWHGALLFAVIPALAVAAFQANSLYEAHGYWSWKVWHPLLFLTPVVAVCAASGFGVANACLRSGKLTMLAGGAVLGLVWTLIFVLAATAAVSGKFQVPVSMARIAGACVSIGRFVLPYTMLMYAALRFYGRKRGFLK